jgi:hypothetical protein
MAENRDRDERKGPDSRWPKYVQFLCVVCLTVLFLMLAMAMQRHHFLQGDLYERTHPTEQ